MNNKRDKLRMITVKLLINPESFFRELKRKNPNYFRPFMIISLFAIFIFVLQCSILMSFTSAIPGYIVKYFMIGGCIGSISSSLGLYGMWLVFTVIVYGLSSFMGGELSFRKLLEHMGYGLVPILIGSLINYSILTVYFNELLDIHKRELIINPGMTEITKLTILNLIPTNIAFIIRIVSLISILYSHWLWSVAIAVEKEVHTWKAAFIILPITIILIFYQVVGLIGYFT